MNTFTDRLFKIGEKNLNGRIYTKEVAEDMIKQFKERGDVLGTMGCQGVNLILDSVSHKVTELFIDEEHNLVATIELLDTPMGDKLRALLKSSPESYTVRPRGTGMVSDDGIVSDYNIVSIDVIPTKDAS